MQPSLPPTLSFDPSIFSDWDIAGQIQIALEPATEYKAVEGDFISRIVTSIKNICIKATDQVAPYYVLEKKALGNPLKLFYFPQEAEIVAPLKKKLGHRRAAGAHKKGCLALLFFLKEKKVEKVWQHVGRRPASIDHALCPNEAMLTKYYGQQPYWPKNHFSQHKILYPKTVPTHSFKTPITRECAIFDYYPYDLKTVSEISTSIPAPLFLKIALGVLEALEFLHKNNIAHCDVKLGNILIGKERALLTDYDHANNTYKTPTQKLSYYTTKKYTSPERFEDNIHAPKEADMYALGITLAKCIAIPTPWSDLFHTQAKKKGAHTEAEKKNILSLQKALFNASEDSIKNIDEPGDDPAVFADKLTYALLHPLHKRRITATKAVFSIKKREYALPTNLIVAIKQHTDATHLKKTS